MCIGVAQLLILATERLEVGVLIELLLSDDLHSVQPSSLSSSSMEAREFGDALLKYTKLYFKD